MDDLSSRLSIYMEKKTPTMGVFILKKQCADLGISFDDIPEEMLDQLAERLAEAVEMFLGYDESNTLKRQIKERKF